MNIRLAELAWLGRQRLPMWGGHLTRGEPVSDANFQAMIDDGLIEAVTEPCLGYVLTEKGRAYVEHANGQIKPNSTS